MGDFIVTEILCWLVFLVLVLCIFKGILCQQKQQTQQQENKVCNLLLHMEKKSIIMLILNLLSFVFVKFFNVINLVTVFSLEFMLP